MLRDLLVVAASLFVSAATLAQSTAFTYQGQLKNGGALAEGQHDFRFRLFDAASGGAQVGTTQCADNILVKDGVFTALIDFGPQFTTTSQRFIEILVRRDIGQSCADTSGFATLAPRQVISPAPVAIEAASAFSLASPDGSPAKAVFVDINGNVGIGATTPNLLAKLQIDSGDLYAGLPTNGWFFHTRSHVNGDFMHVTDTVGGAPQFQRGLVLTKSGSLGIGTTAPAARLDVRGDIRLGSSGQFRAAAGEENLRIIRGEVDVGGTTLRGAGFTATQLEEGRFTLTFSTPFPSPPTVTASAEFHRMAVVWSVTAGSVEIRTLDPRNLSLSGSPFHFIAVGPR